ncbi:hypothetical protein ACFQ4H_34835, partial [Micromonospora sonneratiae]
MGERWPQGDEDKMRELGEVWLQLGRDLAPLEGQLSRAAAAVAAAGDGPAMEAALEFLSQISGGANAVLPKLLESIKEVAAGARKVGLEIEYAKLMIIGLAAMLLLSIMKLMYLLVITGGVIQPMAVLAPLFQFSKEVVKRVLKRLFVAVVQGAAFMVLLDVAVQLLQVAMGSRDIKEWDGQKTGFMAGIGALGGAIGWGLGWMRHLPGARGGTTWKSQLVPWLVTIVKNGLAEGLPELIADEVAKGGGEDFGAKDGFYGGLASGAVEGVIEHPSKVLGRGVKLPLFFRFFDFDFG